MSGIAESHSMDSEQNTSPIIEAMSHPEGLLNSWNQMDRRTISSPLSVITPISGNAINAGMNSRMLTMLTNENTSAMRVSGRRQWLLVNRKGAGGQRGRCGQRENERERRDVESPVTMVGEPDRDQFEHKAHDAPVSSAGRRTIKTQRSRPEPALLPLDNAGHQPRTFGDYPHLRAEMAVLVGIVSRGINPVGVVIVALSRMGLCFASHQCPPLRGYWSIFFR